MSRYQRTYDFNNLTRAKGTEVKSEFDAIEAYAAEMPAPETFAIGSLNLVTAGGTANAITISAPTTWTTYTGKGSSRFAIKITAANTGAVTLNVDGLGAVACVRTDNVALATGDLLANVTYDFTYSEELGKFFVTAFGAILVQAAAYVTAASDQATLSAGYATASSNSASASASSASSASGFATAASGHADSAALEVTYAAEWAINAKDVPVSVAAGGDGSTTFSSLHWAAKARPLFANLQDVNFTALADTQIPSYDSGTGKWVNIDLPAPPGQGGTSITGDVTLTASSPGAMTVTPTLYGRYATLPDATTCEKGVSLFSIYNDSDFYYGIKNSAGNKLGWIKPNEGLVIGLSDNSTAAGVWSLPGISRLGISGKYTGVYSPSFTYVKTERVAVDLDGDIEIITYENSPSSYPCAIAFRKRTGEFGAPLVIVTTGSIEHGIQRRSDTEAVVGYRATASTFVARVLTVDPTDLSLTPGSTTTFTLPTNTRANQNSSMFVSIPDVPGSYVLPYDTGSGNGVVAFSVSSGVVTFGTDQALTGSGNGVICIAYGDKIITASWTSGTIYIKPFTVSGNTLTPGTQASVAVGGIKSTNPFKIVEASTDKWWIIANEAAQCGVFLATLSGTTITATGVAALTAPCSEAIAVNSTKILVVSSGTSSNSNIIRDVSGTATAGTNYTLDSSTQKRLVSVPETDRVAYMTSNGTNISFMLLGCSGNSPVNLESLSDASDTLGLMFGSLNDYLTLGVETIKSPDGEFLTTLQQGSSFYYNYSINGRVVGRRITDGPMHFGNKFARGETDSERWSGGASTSFLVKWECV